MDTVPAYSNAPGGLHAQLLCEIINVLCIVITHYKLFRMKYGLEKFIFVCITDRRLKYGSAVLWLPSIPLSLIFVETDITTTAYTRTGQNIILLLSLLPR